MKKQHKIALLTANIISLAMIAPAIIVLILLVKFMNLGDFNSLSAEYVQELLNKTIYGSDILPATIFYLIFTVANACLAVYIFMYVKEYKVFAFSLFILGGMFFANIIFGISYLMKIKDKKIKVNWKHADKVGLIGLIITPFLSIIPLGMVSNSKIVDKPTNVKNVSFSTNKTNLIEIFTDGFDEASMNPLLKDVKTFKDFYTFPKFISPGFLTNISVPWMIGDKDDALWNFKIKHNISDYNEAYDKSYEEAFMVALKKHFYPSQGREQFKNKYLINPVNFSHSSSYTAQISGEADEITKENPDLKVVNWAQAKNDNAGKFGISNLSPDGQTYQWTQKHLTISNDAPSMMLIQDMITHSPSYGDLDFSYKNDRHAERFRVLKNSLVDFINALKNTKDANGSIYDSSLIVIFGDHADHSKVTNKIKDKVDGDVLANRSNLMIKYPHDKNTNTEGMRIINNRAIYAPYLQKIIDNGLSTNDGVNFINYNNNFRMDRNFLTFAGHTPYAFFSHFENQDPNSKFVINKTPLQGFGNIAQPKPGWFPFKQNKEYVDKFFDVMAWEVA